MQGITGGHDRTGGSRFDTAGAATLLVSDLPDPADGGTERRLADALRRCVARWGLAKTTIEDIAREAGTSRATVYRLCPGGKLELLELAVWCDVRRLVDLVEQAVADAADLEDALVSALHGAMCFLDGHDALCFVREHEPVVFDQFLDFERAEQILRCAGDLLQPAFERHLSPDDARATAVWLARLVLSHVQTPSPSLDLTDRDDVERLVRAFVVPGLRPLANRQPPAGAADTRAGRSPGTATT